MGKGYAFYNATSRQSGDLLYVNDFLHSWNDKPAVLESFPLKGNINCYWYQKEQLHRGKDQPAVENFIIQNDRLRRSLEWHWKGQLYRRNYLPSMIEWDCDALEPNLLLDPDDSDLSSLNTSTARVREWWDKLDLRSFTDCVTEIEHGWSHRCNVYHTETIKPRDSPSLDLVQPKIATSFAYAPGQSFFSTTTRKRKRNETFA